MARVSKLVISIALLTQFIACSSSTKTQTGWGKVPASDSKEFSSIAEEKHEKLLRRYSR